MVIIPYQLIWVRNIMYLNMRNLGCIQALDALSLTENLGGLSGNEFHAARVLSLLTF